MIAFGLRRLGGASVQLPRWMAALLLMLAAACAWADTTGDVQPVPPLSGHVIDRTATLSSAQSQALERKLMAFEKARGTQLIVLLVPTTMPEDIAAYANRVGNAWKIGRRDVGDGLLLIVAKQDRSIRIEVAKALEGAVPDLAASQIIERAIKPAFKAGDFAGGLNLGVDQLINRIQAENLPTPNANGNQGVAPLIGQIDSQNLPPRPPKRQPSNDGFQFNDLIVFGLIGVPLIFGVLSSILGRKAGAVGTGLIGGGLAWVFTSSLLIGFGAAVVAAMLALAFGNGGRGRSGWGGPPMGGGWGGGGGFGGSGGWSSGGGGDFGGGGASGKW
jgi:uncharacterized protein